MTAPKDSTRRLAVVTAVMLCSYAIAMESTVVSAAIPTVIAGFGGLSGLSWVFSAYLIAQVVTMPLFGSASDRMDRRVCFLLAAAVFSFGTLTCGLSWNMPTLVLSRVLQGVGAGGLLTVGTASLNDLIDQNSRGKYQAMGSAVWGLAAVSGPVVGSAIMTFLDWRYIFWINLPVILVSSLLMHGFYPARAVKAVSQKIAFLPSLFLCVALLAVMAALVYGSSMSRLQSAACLFAGGVGAMLLVQAQRRADQPLFPPDLIRMKTVKVAAMSAFLCGGISMAATVYLPGFIALILRADYLTISSAVAAITLAWTCSAIGVGMILKPERLRLLAITAALVVLAGTVGLCYLVNDVRGTTSFLVVASVLGLGLGACSVVFSVLLQSTVSDDVRGAATSLFYLARMLGQSLGVAVCGGILAGSDESAKALVKQPGSVHASQDFTQLPERFASVRAEFLSVFALIALMALLQLILSLQTPSQPALADA